MGSRASQAAGQIGWEEGKEEQVCCEALALAGGGFSLAGSRGQALDTRGTSIYQRAPKCWTWGRDPWEYAGATETSSIHLGAVSSSRVLLRYPRGPFWEGFGLQGTCFWRGSKSAGGCSTGPCVTLITQPPGSGAALSPSTCLVDKLLTAMPG